MIGVKTQFCQVILTFIDQWLAAVMPVSYVELYYCVHQLINVLSYYIDIKNDLFCYIPVLFANCYVIGSYLEKVVVYMVLIRARLRYM